MLRGISGGQRKRVTTGKGTLTKDHFRNVTQDSHAHLSANLWPN